MKICHFLAALLVLPTVGINAVSAAENSRIGMNRMPATTARKNIAGAVTASDVKKAAAQIEEEDD